MKNYSNLKNLISRNIDLIFIGLFIVFLLVGILSGYDNLFYLANVIAITGFLIVQQPTSKTPDERDHFINHRASSVSFILILTVIVFLSMGLDFIPQLETLGIRALLQGIISFMYITYTIAYAILKRKF